MIGDKRLRKELKETKLTEGLTQAQIDFVKNKMDMWKNWKDIAVAELAAIDNRLDVIEAAGVNLAQRISALETKAGQAATKLTNHEQRINALENP